MTNEKQPPPSLEELLAELRAEVSRLASATATGATYMGRAVKAMETGHSAGSRALTQAAERIERSTSGAQRILTKTERLLDRAAAEPSITVVRDVPTPVEPEKSEKNPDNTGIFYVVGGSGDMKKLRIPLRTKYVKYAVVVVVVVVFIGGIFAGRAGVQPKTVMQYGAHALGVP